MSEGVSDPKRALPCSPLGRAAICLLVFLLASGAAAVTAAADDLEELLRRGGFDPARRGDVRAVFEEAADRGVPSALLLPRVEEGLAKGVPADRMLRGIERELSLLLEAREILSEEAGVLLKDQASWARTANLLAGGLSQREVRTLARVASARPRDYRSATYLYVALAEWGLPRDQAGLLLEALVASRVPGEEFAGIVEILVEGRRARIPPERLAERIRAALPRVQNLDELKKTVLY